MRQRPMAAYRSVPFPGPSDDFVPRNLGVPNYGLSPSGLWVVRPPMGGQVNAQLLSGSWGGTDAQVAEALAALNKPAQGGPNAQCK